MKAWMSALEGKVLAPSVAYLVDWLKSDKQRWQNTPEVIVKGFQHVAAGYVDNIFFPSFLLRFGSKVTLFLLVFLWDKIKVTFFLSRKIKDAFDAIQKHVKAGKDYEDAWNLASVQLIKASEVSSYCFT